MAESSLSLAYADLRARIGYLLNYTRDSSNWDSDQIEHIDWCLEEGLRQFYYPPPLQPGALAHEWSFMRPKASIDIYGDVDGTASGQGTYSSTTELTTFTATAAVFLATMVGMDVTFDTSETSYEIDGFTSTTIVTLQGDASAEASGDGFTVETSGEFHMADNFGGISGNLTYEPNAGYADIVQTSANMIDSWLQTHGSSTARPTHFAMRYKAADGTAGQKRSMIFYPEPSSDYTVWGETRLLKDAIDSSNPYPLGGMEHASTVQASCLACAEQAFLGGRAENWVLFMERLSASIAIDARAQSEQLGLNTNPRRLRASRHGGVIYGTQEGNYSESV